jgi:hypothetical protein
MFDLERHRPIFSRRRALAVAGAGALVAALPGPAAAQAVGAADRLIVPGTRIGAVRKNSTFAQLSRLYGAGNIRRARIDVGEGETEPGYILFPGKPDRLAIVLSAQGRVLYARTTTAGSAWKTAEGIRVGMPVAELVRINGGHFTFSGFGWDGSGMVKDDTSAKLPKSLRLRLGARKADGLTAEERQEITGDITVRTDNPVVAKIEVVLDWIEAYFE